MSKEQIEEMAKAMCLDCAKDSPCSLAQVGGMCSSVRKQAAALYNAGYRKQSEWISVDERLPDESACYLVNIINHFGLDAVTFTYYTKNYGWGVLDVTHWMPLPEPPKQKGGEE